VLTVFEFEVDSQAQEEDSQIVDWPPRHCPFQDKVQFHI